MGELVEAEVLVLVRVAVLAGAGRRGDGAGGGIGGGVAALLHLLSDRSVAQQGCGDDDDDDDDDDEVVGASCSHPIIQGKSNGSGFPSHIDVGGAFPNDHR